MKGVGFKPVPMVEKSISSVLEKIRKRKMEVSKKWAYFTQEDEDEDEGKGNKDGGVEKFEAKEVEGVEKDEDKENGDVENNWAKNDEGVEKDQAKDGEGIEKDEAIASPIKTSEDKTEASDEQTSDANVSGSHCYFFWIQIVSICSIWLCIEKVNLEILI